MYFDHHNAPLSPAPAGAAAEGVATAERAPAAEAAKAAHVHAAHRMMPGAEATHMMMVMMPPAHRRTMIPVTIPRTADCPKDPNENDQSQHFMVPLSLRILQ